LASLTATSDRHGCVWGDMGLYGLYGAAVLLPVQDREHRQGRVRRPLTEGGQAIKKYSIIYADPPWQYKVYSKKGAGRSAESHYPTMSIDELCALPVETPCCTPSAMALVECNISAGATPPRGPGAPSPAPAGPRRPGGPAERGP